MNPRSRLRDVALVTFTTVGWALPPCVGLYSLASSGVRGLGGVAGLVLFAFVVWAIVRGYQRVRAKGPRRYQIAYAALVLAALPVWGLGVNHILSATCVRNESCGEDMDMFRAFAEPWVLAPCALHVVVALAFALSRRRPDRLPPAVEALTLSLMMVGVVLHAALGVQLGASFLVVGLAVFPLGLPVVAPWLTVALFAGELRERLQRRGEEERVTEPTPLPADVYRHVELAPEEAPPPVMSRAWMARAAALTPALLGAYGVLSALLGGRRGAAVAAFTDTCGHTFSRVAVTVVHNDCHYLCTVAAQGHPWLVRPERMGVRNGNPIIVNRQLAVANAFEDLLHTRWPRFGAWCRRVYDRVGLPVSRYLRRRWMADAVYVVMKPFEWCFYAALLALDPGDPEARIDRMYR